MTLSACAALPAPERICFSEPVYGYGIRRWPAILPPVTALSRFGATHVFPAEAEELAAGVREITQGRGADLILELAGATETVQAGLALVRTGGAAMTPSCKRYCQPPMVLALVKRTAAIRDYDWEGRGTGLVKPYGVREERARCYIRLQ
jgi:hypothetical protein